MNIVQRILSLFTKKKNTGSGKNSKRQKTKTIDYKLCELIFTEPSSFDDKKKFEIELSQTISEFISVKNPRHVPYDEIAYWIFQKLDSKRFKGLTTDVNEILTTHVPLDHTDKDYKKLEENLDKLQKDTIRHIKLSILQRELVTKESQKAQVLSEKALKKVNEANDKLEGIDRIYSDFVSILGIFTAITFATFGGLQLLGNVFGNIKDVTFNNIGGTVILGGIFVAGTYLLLIALFSGISKISNIKKGYHPSRRIAALVLSFCGLLVYFGLNTMKDSHNGLIKNDDANKNDTYNINFTQKPDIGSSQQSSESK